MNNDGNEKRQAETEPHNPVSDGGNTTVRERILKRRCELRQAPEFRKKTAPERLAQLVDRILCPEGMASEFGRIINELRDRVQEKIEGNILCLHAHSKLVELTRYLLWLAGMGLIEPALRNRIIEAFCTGDVAPKEVFDWTPPSSSTQWTEEHYMFEFRNPTNKHMWNHIITD